ncbi:uncharacterized protein TNCV_3844751 [Trichonephila clavipes]|nr:uncharacterized protein TNCV_3844751 [Trichonephila clavipes]
MSAFSIIRYFVGFVTIPLHTAVNRLLCGYEPHFQGTLATLNHYAVLSSITPETFDTARNPLLFRPRIGCNPRIKKAVRDHPRDPSEVKENKRWSVNFVKSGPQKTPPSQTELEL